MVLVSCAVVVALNLAALMVCIIHTALVPGSQAGA